MAGLETNDADGRTLQSAKDMVEIKIIEEDMEESFVVVKEDICNSSPYFTAAFKGGFREADDGFIELRDTTIETFKHFVTWLKRWECGDQPDQRRVIDDVDDEDDEDDSWASDEEELEEGPLWLGYHNETAMANLAVDMYLFADAYDVPQLRCDAADRLIQCIEVDKSTVSCMSKTSISRAYAQTTPESPLRKLLVDGFCIRRFDKYETKASLMKYPKEFLIDAMEGNAHVFNIADDQDMRVLRNCNYHGYRNQNDRKNCKASRVSDHCSYYYC